GSKALLSWITDALAECGVEVVHLIVSDRSKFDTRVPGLSDRIDIRPTECPDWHLGNGRSAAWAQHVVSDERFFLLMSDHLIRADHLRRVSAFTPCALGTSTAAPWI